ncbi:MAG TPA: serine/threonine-protein kinase [Candidatus Binatia bacterium]|jgi:WD40 repeat protein|nr:serine/threonine-protein kinase [Candidatus Binatia bacterium]
MHCTRCLIELAVEVARDDVHDPATAPLRFGDYEALERIGVGGMGVVYKARQLSLDRLVALKVIKPGMDSVRVLARFEAERQALALMEHPNIARVFDAGTTPAGHPYFAMELVEGVPLTRFCDEQRLSIEERLELFMLVCQAVQHAHQKGIIHRDLKPANVLVTVQDGKAIPKVIDFGVAKAIGPRLTRETVATEIGALVGTLEYMSPEQADLNQVDIDTRSDIYALGILLYELLTGTTPLTRRTLRQAAFDEVLRRIRQEEPPRPSTRLSETREELASISARRRVEPARLTRVLRGDLDWIVMKALEKERNRRYETANGLAQDIHRHLNDEPVVAGPPSKAYRFQKLVRRNKLVFASVTVVATALLIGLGATTYSWLFAKSASSREKAAREQAQANQSNAETAALEAKTTLSRSDFFEAVHLVSEDRASEALAYLQRSLSANPENYAAATRLATLLTYHAWMQPTRMFKHNGPAQLLQFSPDCERLLTVSDDNSVHVWDTKTDQPLIPPLTHASKVRVAQFSSDGNSILTISEDNTARVWEVPSGRLQIEFFSIGSSPVLLARFSPDGKRMVTVAEDRTARAWDIETGQPLTEPIFADVATGRPLAEAVEFSPDGGQIVTISGNEEPNRSVGAVSLGYTNANGTNGLKLVFSAAVLGFSNSANGLELKGPSYTVARVWDVATGLQLAGPLEHGAIVTSARFSPDGKWLVTTAGGGNDDYEAHLWDLRGGQLPNDPPHHYGAAQPLPSSTNGMAVGNEPKPPLSLRLIGESREAPAPAGIAFLRHSGPVLLARFSPDGKWIVTVSEDKTARVWEVRTGRPLTDPLRHHDAVYLAEFSPDSRRLVTVCRDKVVRVWDPASGHPVTEPLRTTDNVAAVRFMPNRRQIATISADNVLRVWRDRLPQTELVGGFLQAVKLSRETRWITTSWSNNIPRGPIPSTQFSPDERRVVVFSNNIARVWNAGTGQPLTSPLIHGGAVTSAQFSPDGTKILTASADNAVRLWDAQTGRLIKGPLWCGGTIGSAEFSPEGRWFLTASEGAGARVWDTESGQLLADSFEYYPDQNYAEFRPEGNRILTYSQEGPARLYDIAPAKGMCPSWLPQLSEVICGQKLNDQGILEPTQLNTTETIEQIRERLSHASDSHDWTIWGGWYLADPSKRTVSPFSKITVSEYIENLIEQNTVESLAEAKQLAAGNREQEARIEQARKTLLPQNKASP